MGTETKDSEVEVFMAATEGQDCWRGEICEISKLISEKFGAGDGAGSRTEEHGTERG